MYLGSLPYAFLGTNVSYRKPIQEEASSKRVEVDPLLGRWWTKIEPGGPGPEQT